MTGPRGDRGPFRGSHRPAGDRHTPEAVSQFVDECNLHVKAGDGGAGSVSFRREAHVAKGGPDGGDGGSGGDVWLVADHNVASLLAFKDQPFRRAGDGTHGQGKRRHGAGRAGAAGAGPRGDGRAGPRRHRAGRPGPAPATATWRPRADAGARQRPLPLQPAAGTGVRRAGRGGRGALAAPRAQAAGRRGAGGVPQRGQVDAHQPHLRRQAQGGRLSVHDAGTASRRGAARRRLRVRGGRHPRAHRGRERGARAGPPLPAPHRTGPRAVPAPRPGPGGRAAARRAARGAAGRAGRLPARPART